jgi:RNA polymerase sigma factor (sigma-70 family)
MNVKHRVRTFSEETDAIKLLYRDLKKYKPLSKKEEGRLYLLAKAGDKKSKDKFINSNIRFAILVARKYVNENFLLEDCVGEALIGLMEAYENFDLEKNTKFITHAFFYIQRRLSMAQQGLIRLPNTDRVIRQKVVHARNRLEQQHSGEIPLSLIEEEMDLPRHTLERFSYQTVRYDDLIEDDNL